MKTQSHSTIKITYDYVYLSDTLYQRIGNPKLVEVVWDDSTATLRITPTEQSAAGIYKVAVQPSGAARINARVPIAQSQIQPGMYSTTITSENTLLVRPDQALPQIHEIAPTIRPLILSLPQVAALCGVPYTTLFRHTQYGHIPTVETVGNERTAHFMTIEHVNIYRQTLGLEPITEQDVRAFFTEE